MQTLASALLLSCCFMAELVHSQYEEGYAGQIRSIWEDPIEFPTKAQDQCSMTVTGQRDMTILRVSCQSRDRSYWCEYRGKPQVCRSYNKNPRHFFTQIMWELRKLRNACQGPSVLKPFMCKKAPEEAQMVFTTSSSPDTLQPAWTRPDSMRIPSTNFQQMRPGGAGQNPSRSQTTRYQPAKSAQTPGEQAKAAASKSRLIKVVRPRPTTPKTTPSPPSSPAPTGKAKRLAQENCWPSLQSACAYVIGWFTY